MDRSRAASALRRLQRSTTTPMEDDYRALSMPLVDNEAGGPAPRSVVSDMSNWMGGMGGQLKGRTRSSRRTQGMSHVNSSEVRSPLTSCPEPPLSPTRGELRTADMSLLPDDCCRQRKG